ncbi:MULTISPECIES: ECF transporter S component [Exiguobacterium]|uniref:ECF transporter S component n=1 Tax=Exiguobacterium acetylicum TaxID=41170 RepID=A0ABX8GAN2_EXIAC|nr:MULTISPECIES: ECF transporter S component [Exiguobacterium]AOS99130.1 ECF transporter S component [Exiguobacterium sp. U13-1]MBF8154435.1 ECF transporter S component [Exiguobacterium sp. TBG-PICH-001]QWB30092.1 ECF transporter S component [Exiguobacterium acetylicum]
MQKAAPYSSTRTRQLVITAMSIALVLVATLFINIKLPIASSGGLVHMGTAMLFLIAILFGPRTALIAGAIGMGLFDLISGWTLWAPFTIVARGLQGYIVGRIAWSSRYKGDNPGLNIFAMIVSAPVMLAVYYVCEGILYSNWVAPVASIPGNITQNVVGILVAIPVGIALKKTRFFRNFR